MLRVLGSAVILLLLLLNWLLPATPLGLRGPDSVVRLDVSPAIEVGATLPDVMLVDLGAQLPDGKLTDLGGAPVSLASLRGHRVLLVFERSIDWCPFTKERLLGLHEAVEEAEDLQIVWVMAAQQISERTNRLIEELGLRERIRFLADDQSAVIRQLGVLKPEPEVMEEGVPHPTTILLDREGIVRFVDVRADYHFWLDPKVLLAALEDIE